MNLALKRQKSKLTLVHSGSALEQRCLIELPTKMKVFFICAVKYHSHGPYVLTEHMKCS